MGFVLLVVLSIIKKYIVKAIAKYNLLILNFFNNLEKIGG